MKTVIQSKETAFFCLVVVLVGSFKGRGCLGTRVSVLLMMMSYWLVHHADELMTWAFSEQQETVETSYLNRSRQETVETSYPFNLICYPDDVVTETSSHSPSLSG